MPVIDQLIKQSSELNGENNDEEEKEEEEEQKKKDQREKETDQTDCSFSLRRTKESMEALSVPFPSASGNCGPKVGYKTRVSHVFGKVPCFNPRSRALSAVEQSSARWPGFYGDRPAEGT
ncbi:hypothetical protein WN51_07424 [Melipona quadrifasciata]|uniref:Uncharacterized protein n=1 Tax=Melipona quadrifasciata TaxID=166423 RepID=A0A0M8ZRB7_9HYME|nr:hypothetical protein WN51_07424 [Melipona quadrifasciata]